MTSDKGKNREISFVFLSRRTLSLTTTNYKVSKLWIYKAKATAIASFVKNSNMHKSLERCKGFLLSSSCIGLQSQCNAGSRIVLVGFYTTLRINISTTGVRKNRVQSWPFCVTTQSPAFMISWTSAWLFFYIVICFAAKGVSKVVLSMLFCWESCLINVFEGWYRCCCDKSHD